MDGGEQLGRRLSFLDSGTIEEEDEKPSSSPSIFDVKNAWIFTFAPFLLFFVVIFILLFYCLIKHRIGFAAFLFLNTSNSPLSMSTQNYVSMMYKDTRFSAYNIITFCVVIHLI
jgi:hypothetical protein